MARIHGRTYSTHDQTQTPSAHIAGTVVLAFGLWYFSFVLPWGNFWVKMAVSASLLAAISLATMDPARRREELAVTPRHILTGAASAVGLYFVFRLGGWLLPMLLRSAGSEIPSVYAYGHGTSLGLISFLLLFVTGPAEEVYWRGFLQHHLARRSGPVPGLLLSTAIYAIVHIWTFNVSLILAAFVAGLAWGLLYMTQKSLVPSIISHSLWGFIIFVVFPVV